MHYYALCTLCLSVCFLRMLLLFFLRFSLFHSSNMRDSSTTSQCENILKKKTKINKETKSSSFHHFFYPLLYICCRAYLNLAKWNEQHPTIMTSFWCRAHNIQCFCSCTFLWISLFHHSLGHIVLAHIIYLMTWLKPFQTIAQ